MTEGTRFVWAPATSFLVGEMQPAMPGDKRLGAVLYELDGPTSAAEIVDVPGLREYRLDDVIHEVYPRPSSSSGSR
jgi:alkaline phosphatase D